MSEISIIDSDPEVIHKFKGHKKALTCITFDPANKQLASSSHDNTIMIWNLTAKNIRCYSFSGHTDVVSSIDFSRSGNLLASGSHDRNIRLWIPKVRGGSSTFRAHSAAVTCVKFLPDSNWLLSGSRDKSIKAWSVQAKKFVASYVGHNNWINSIDVTTDGKIIASCSDDRTVRLWDCNIARIIHSFPMTKGVGNCVAFHPNNVSIAVAMNSGSVRIYDTRALKLQQHYILHDNTKCAAWHPYANYLLTCGADGNMRIVDVMEGRPLYTLNAHEKSIECLVFSKDGDHFASGGLDKLVQVWKTNFIQLNDSPASSDVW